MVKDVVGEGTFVLPRQLPLKSLTVTNTEFYLHAIFQPYVSLECSSPFILTTTTNREASTISLLQNMPANTATKQATTLSGRKLARALRPRDDNRRAGAAAAAARSAPDPEVIVLSSDTEDDDYAPQAKLPAKRKKKSTRDENAKNANAGAGSSSKGQAGASRAGSALDVTMAGPRAESSTDAQLRGENERLKQVRIWKVFYRPLLTPSTPHLTSSCALHLLTSRSWRLRNVPKQRCKRSSQRARRRTRKGKRSIWCVLGIHCAVHIRWTNSMYLESDEGIRPGGLHRVRDLHVEDVESCYVRILFNIFHQSLINVSVLLQVGRMWPHILPVLPSRLVRHDALPTHPTAPPLPH